MSKYVAAFILVFTIKIYFLTIVQPSASYKCTTGVLYVLNKCNMCQCSRGNLSPCTGLSCSGENYYLAKYCDVGKKWQEDCNDCECAEQYGTVCTAKECPETKAPSRENDDSSEPDPDRDSSYSNPDPSPLEPLGQDE